MPHAEESVNTDGNKRIRLGEIEKRTKHRHLNTHFQTSYILHMHEVIQLQTQKLSITTTSICQSDINSETEEYKS